MKAERKKRRTLTERKKSAHTYTKWLRLNRQRRKNWNAPKKYTAIKFNDNHLKFT